MKLLRIYLPALFVLLTMFTGCNLKDADCPANLRIYFVSNPATRTNDNINPAEIGKIELYIFDAQGILQSIKTDNNPAFGPDYYMTISGLSAGDYRFVAWAGRRDIFSVTPSGAELVIGKTKFSEFHVLLSHISNRVGDNSVHYPLFHADKSDYVTVQYIEQSIYATLAPMHNIINLTTEGLRINSDSYSLEIHDKWNGRYGFDRSFTATGNVLYLAQCAKDSQGQLSASLNMLRVTNSRQPVFIIYNTTKKEILFEADLLELINKIQGINLETTHIYNIHIRFSTDIAANVSINGWDVTEWIARPR